MDGLAHGEPAVVPIRFDVATGERELGAAVGGSFLFAPIQPAHAADMREGFGGARLQIEALKHQAVVRRGLELREFAH